MTSPSAELFAGPGELRRLCRDLDWSASPLGPVATWSPVLRSTFRLCLDSGFPILINWGPEMVALYNDAFTPMLGGKHPVALGQSAKDTWPEALAAIGTRLDDVLVRGQTLRFVNERQFLERNGYSEECHFTFSNSPIRDDDGTIVGLFTASSETTQEILNERRMRVVRELGAISAAVTTTMAQTCQAVLDVLARTRESLPFAVAFLTGPGRAAERVAAYGLTAHVPGGVFDRFHRVGTDAAQGGAGIGLALVADLVHAHLGNIDLVSAPGQGSNFTVTLPLDTESNIAAPTSVDQGAATRLSQSAPGMSSRPRALLVEDDTDLRAYISRLMTRDGWDVDAVADAETALSVISRSARPAVDLVLTDLMLPGRDGLHLVTELRRLDPTSRLPLIVLTARSGVEAIAIGMAAGADDYITKPFASQELLARLRANHELHQLREQAVDATDERTAQVRGGLQSNRVIGTAIGIPMTTHRLSTEQGFALLVAAS